MEGAFRGDDGPGALDDGCQDNNDLSKCFMVGSMRKAATAGTGLPILMFPYRPATMKNVGMMVFRYSAFQIYTCNHI